MMYTPDLFDGSPTEFVRRFAKHVRRTAIRTHEKHKAKQLELRLRRNKYPKRMPADTGRSELTIDEAFCLVPEILIRSIELMLDRTCKERLEIENWVFDPDPKDPRSFDHYCEFVGVDPDVFRSGLKRAVARRKRMPANILRVAS